MRVYFAFFVCFMLVGCGQEKNTDFFVKNQTEIEPMLKECSASMEYAIKAKDEKRYKEIMDSLECNAAKSAKKEILRVKREEELRLINEQRKLHDEKVSKFYNEMMGYDVSTLISKVRELDGNCNYLNMDEKIKYQCDAYRIKRNDIKINLIESINKSFNYNDLLVEKDIRCGNRDVLKPSLECVAFEDAQYIAFKKLVDVATSNIDLVKETYNSCVERYQQAKKSSGYQAARVVEKEHECQVVNSAAKELKLVSKFSLFTNKIN
ncbi:hypothetical protein D9A33_18530 [Vibrio cholerae]|nr:hypothetical protein [Vibrio cholerae]ELL1566657.1 hypothetical protein [Vibrio cholerae]